MSQSTPLSEIARLCEGRPDIPASELDIAGYLPGPRPQNAESEILFGRSREIARELGSGALKVMKLEYYNDGKGVVPHDDTAPIVGSLAILVAANRSYSFRNATWGRQATTLQLLFHAGDTVTAMAYGTVPFDEAMETETRTAWDEIGIDMNYSVGDTADHFAPTLRPDYQDSIIARLSQES
jgi:hypothetical protein